MESYTTNFLLDRIYDKLEQNNTNMQVPRPIVEYANQRTCILNFRNICYFLKRSELNIQAFFDAELSVKSSIDSNGCFITKGKFKENGIQNVLASYIKEYVICKECKNGYTEIYKENRMTYIKCSKCKSKRSLQH